MESRVVIARKEQVPERGAFRFVFDSEGGRHEGVLIRLKGRLYAYLNVCAHVPLKLDQGTGQFLGPGGGTIRCLNHSAVFDTVTGRCLSGPPKGRFLRYLSVREEGTEIVLLVRDAAKPSTPTASGAGICDAHQSGSPACPCPPDPPAPPGPPADGRDPTQGEGGCP